MFWRILKKDLKRKKTINIILLLFMVLCSMFAAASVNNIIAVVGGLVTLLHTFLALRHTDLPYHLVFLASAEEEVSGKQGIEAVLPLLPSIDVGLVGEPTGMQVAVAEKGLMVLDCTTHGRSGHAARNEGDNALYKALPYVEWFGNYKFEKTSPVL